MRPVIQVKNLGKEYRKGRPSGYVALRDVFAGILMKPFKWLKIKVSAPDVFWALKDINFEVHKGEVLGIIGSNGAGKSTLLKVLSRITYPTTGEVRIKGMVSSLLEVGTGFHPELSGRENVYLNGSVLGMTRKEIRKKFDDIVSFAGVEEFIDMPIKRYSSGMQVRLAFAVAAHLDPDILIVDEVLAVGDAAFQKKSLAKMERVTRTHGRTILFVSHNMNAITRLCKRVIWLDEGKIRMEGSANKVVDAYLEEYGGESAQFEFPQVESDEKKIVLERIGIYDHNGKPQRKLDVSKPFEVRVDYTVKKDVQGGYVGVNFFDLTTNTQLMESLDVDTNPSLYMQRRAGSYTSTFSFPAGLFNAITLKLFVHAGVFPNTKNSVHKSMGDLTISFFDHNSFATKVMSGRRKTSLLMKVPTRVISRH